MVLQMSWEVHLLVKNADDADLGLRENPVEDYVFAAGIASQAGTPLVVRASDQRTVRQVSALADNHTDIAFSLLFRPFPDRVISYLQKVLPGAFRQQEISHSPSSSPLSSL